MKDFYSEFTLNGKKYLLAFDLNVMEAIQAEYKTIENWSKLTNGDTTGEGDAKAILFGFTEMLNEGIEIMNEQNGTDNHRYRHRHRQRRRSGTARRSRIHYRKADRKVHLRSGSRRHRHRGSRSRRQ